MSDSNGRPAPIPPAPNRAGAVNLQASLLRTRVKEIGEAALKHALPPAPIVREDVVVTHSGPIEQVNTDVVIEHVNAKRWQILAKLGILGIDPSIGAWSLVEIGYGENKEGALVAHFALTWQVADAVEKKSPLAIVE